MRAWIAVLLLGLILPVSVLASGFAIIEQSARGIGHAYAGATADTEDPAAVFFNPAGLSGIKQPVVSAGAHAILPSFEFENKGSSYPLLANMPVTGNNGGDGGVNAYVPNLYYAAPGSESLVFGIGIHAPYGLETEYDKNWVGRYHAIKTRLMTLDINPSVAWKVNDAISLGAGLSAQYAEAELTSAVDFGTILGVAPQMLDGNASVEGDDWAYGYNLGLTVQPCPKTTIGLSYRSSIKHELEGDATFTVPTPAQAVQAMGMFVDTTGKADLQLPPVAGAGLVHQLNEKLALRADVAWTGWSKFEELRVRYSSSQPDSVTDESWDDTMRYAVGINYTMNSEWILRFGAAYDESPVPDAQHRTPRIPDTDRTWLSCGIGYTVSDNIQVDIGYTHLFFNDSDVDVITGSGDRLVGSYSGEADIISAQIAVDL